MNEHQNIVILYEYTKEEVFRKIENLIETEDIDSFDNENYLKSWFYRKNEDLIVCLHEDYYDDFKYLYKEKYLEYKELLGE